MIIKQIVIRLSDEDHQMLKLKTVENKTSIQEVIQQFIKQYIGENSDNKK